MVYIKNSKLSPPCSGSRDLENVLKDENETVQNPVLAQRLAFITGVWTLSPFTL